MRPADQRCTITKGVSFYKFLTTCTFTAYTKFNFKKKKRKKKRELYQSTPGGYAVSPHRPVRSLRKFGGPLFSGFIWPGLVKNHESYSPKLYHTNTRFISCFFFFININYFVLACFWIRQKYVCSFFFLFSEYPLSWTFSNSFYRIKYELYDWFEHKNFYMAWTRSYG